MNQDDATNPASPTLLPEALLWSEGMLLSPQHFQQQEIHLQAQLHQRLAGLSPYAWGLRHLRLDQANLAKGQLAVEECDAVLEDGLPLVFRAANRTPAIGESAPALNPLVIDLAGEGMQQGDRVRVVLGIPPRAGARDWISTSIRRYEPVMSRPTLDENLGTGDVQVERQRVKVQLFTERKLPAGYVGLALCEVELRDGYRMTAFHAPSLRLAACEFLAERSLLQRFRALRTALHERLDLLIGAPAADLPDQWGTLGDEAQANLRVAREIAGCLPLVDGMLVDPLCAPSQAWQLLLQVAGRMSAIGSDPRPPNLVPYWHQDAEPQFDKLLQHIERKLAMADSTWQMLYFEREGEYRFSIGLPADAGHAPLLIELRPVGAQTPEHLLQWLRESRIGSDRLLPVLRQRRQCGADVRPLPAKEVADLGLAPTAMVFALTPQSLALDEGPDQAAMTGATAGSRTVSTAVSTITPGARFAIQGEGGHGPGAILLLRHRGGPGAGDPRARRNPPAGAGHG